MARHTRNILAIAMGLAVALFAHTDARAATCYRDPGYSVSQTTFTQDQTVYCRQTGLNSTYLYGNGFLWFDSNRAVPASGSLTTWMSATSTVSGPLTLNAAAATGTWQIQLWSHPWSAYPGAAADSAVNSLRVFNYDGSSDYEICACAAGGTVACLKGDGVTRYSLADSGKINFDSTVCSDGTFNYFVVGNSNTSAQSNVLSYHYVSVGSPSNEVGLGAHRNAIGGLACGDMDGDGFSDDYGVLTDNGRAAGWRVPEATQIWSSAAGSINRTWYSDANAIATKDLNGDGKADMAVGGCDANANAVCLKSATGTAFTGWPRTTGNAVYSVAIGDTDGDGQDEIVAGSRDSKVYVWKKSGGTPRTYTVSATINMITLGNIDADARQEIIVGTTSTTTSLYLLEDNGTTITLNPGTTTPNPNVGTAASVVHVGAVTGGTYPDIVVGGATVGRVAVYDNNGNLEWQSDAIAGQPTGQIVTMDTGSLNPSVDSVPDIAVGSTDQYVHLFTQGAAPTNFTVQVKPVVTETFTTPTNTLSQVTAGYAGWPLAQVSVSNAASADRATAEINKLKFKFVQSTSTTAIPDATINSMFSTFTVFMENNADNAYSATADVNLAPYMTGAPVVLSGYVTFTFTDEAANLLLAQGTTKKYYLVATTAAGSDAQAFRIYNGNQSAGLEDVIWDNNLESGTVTSTGTAYTSATALNIQARPAAVLAGSNASHNPTTSLSAGMTGNDLAQVQVTNSGAAGRAQLEVSSLRFRFTSDAGGTTPMNPGAAFQNFKIYMENNGNDAYDAGTDPEVAQSGSPAVDGATGYATVTLADENAYALITQAQGSKKYYLVADVPSTPVNGDYYVTHAPGTDAVARENNHDTNVTTSGTSGYKGPFMLRPAAVTASAEDTGLPIGNSARGELIKVIVNNTGTANPLRVLSMRFNFTTDGTTAMTTAQAQLLFSSLGIYRDSDADGVFTFGVDSTINTVAAASFALTATGQQEIPMNDNVTLGASATYFLVVQMQSTAANGANRMYAAAHDPSTHISADDGTYPVTVTGPVPAQTHVLKAAYWRQKIGGAATELYGSATVMEGVPAYSSRVYVGGDDGVLRAIEISTGNVLWTYSVGGAVRGDPFWWRDTFTPAFNKPRIHFTADDGNIYTLTDEGNSASLGWSATLHVGVPDRVTPTARIYRSGATNEIRLYVGCQNGATSHIHAFRADTGAVSWTSSVIGGSVQGNKASNSTVFFGAANGTFGKVQTSDGLLIQSFTAAGSVDGSASLNSASLWFAGGNKLYCRAYSNLTQTCAGWTDFTAGGNILNTPWTTAGGASTKVFAGTSEGAVYGVNMTTGAQTWRYPAAGNIGAVRATIFEDYQVALYFPSDDGYVYSTSIAGALQSGWPVYIGMATSPAVNIRPMVMTTADNKVIVGSTKGYVFAFPKN